VLDGVSADLAEAAGFAELLELLLSFPRVRTLLTAVDPVNRPLQGGAEKVLEMKPLSKHNTARLICRLSPRPLQLDEIKGAANAQDFVQRLASHDLVGALAGNPGRVKATVPQLSQRRLHEVVPCELPEQHWSA
jgi:hypothetical protein